MKKLSEIKEEVFTSDWPVKAVKLETLMDKVSFYFASRLVLKECPFCGRSPTSVRCERITMSDDKVVYRVEVGCDIVNCGVRVNSGGYLTYKEALISAVDKWQRRKVTMPMDKFYDGNTGEGIWQHIHDPETPVINL